MHLQVTKIEEEEKQTLAHHDEEVLDTSNIGYSGSQEFINTNSF